MELRRFIVISLWVNMSLESAQQGIMESVLDLFIALVNLKPLGLDSMFILLATNILSGTS